MNGHTNMDIDDDDELLAEIDVQLHRTNQSIYLFQYPIRPHFRKYDETSFIHARIKEEHTLVEMDLLIDSQSDNYYPPRGKQFAESVNTDQGKSFFNSDRMDKQTIASTHAIDGACYFVGFFDPITRQLILCPLKAITQLRPQFSYLDPSTVSTKDGQTIDDDPGNVSDGEQSGSESEDTKPELNASLVTMKFDRKESDYHRNKRLQSYNYYRQKLDEDRWQDLMCVMNVQSIEAQRLRQEFLTINPN